MPEKITIIPCSGMGKVYGLISRECALKVLKELCPDKTDTICLAYAAAGDDVDREPIKDKKCITVDGCPHMCATKNIELAGGDVIENLKVMGTIRKLRCTTPGNVTELSEEGWKVVDELAHEIAEKINVLSGG